MPAAGLGLGTVGTVRFTDLLANGQAVGRMNGMVVFVSGPLPGERASVRITQVKPKYAVAEVVAAGQVRRLPAANTARAR